MVKESRDHGLDVQIPGIFGSKGSGFRILDLGFGATGFGFWVLGLGLGLG